VFVADLPTSTETDSQSTSLEPMRFSSSDTHQEFIKQRDKLPNALRAFLTPHSPDDYISMEAELYLSDTKSSGFGLKPNGELISVFSLPGAHEGDIAMKVAKELGAQKLDCLGEDLRKFYEKHGFEVKAYKSWNNEFRPDGWDEENGSSLISMGSHVSLYTNSY
jgi:hypothetical protein